jgi:hypothetical protein
MLFRCTTKSAMYHLSILSRVVLALALAIGASGAIFSGSRFQSVPFLNDDAHIENADAADSTDETKLPDLQKSSEITEANWRPVLRKSDSNGRARSKRGRGILLSTSERNQQSEQSVFDDVSTGFMIPGGLNSW